MEIKKRLDYRVIIISAYFFAFLIYLIIGFMPAGATNYEITTTLSIPSANIYSDVTKLSLKSYELKTPDTIVGSFSRAENKTLLIGHKATVFSNLDSAKIGDEIIYNDTTYYIYDIYTVDKSKINMNKILQKAENDTLVLMTCAGEPIDETDATQRLLIWATK